MTTMRIVKNSPPKKKCKQKGRYSKETKPRYLNDNKGLRFIVVARRGRHTMWKVWKTSA
jgi:hypothetical protein